MDNPKRTSTIYVRENGERVYYKVVDPLVLESLMALNRSGQNTPFFNFFRTSKRFFTQAVTADPAFKMANLIRDTISSVAVSPTSYNFFGNVWNGWKDTGKNSKSYASMLAGGGSFQYGHFLGNDPNKAKDLIKAGIRKEFVLDNERGHKTFLQAFNKYITMGKKSVVKGYEGYEGFGNRLENVNRMALYQRLRDQGKSHLEASYEARDLMDFSLEGSWGAIHYLAQWSPFLNARLQGLYKLGRASITPGQRAQFAVTSAAYVTASLGLYLTYKDDEDFKKREEWDRDSYHWFKIPFTDQPFRIPKVFELGAVATLAERTLEQIVDDEADGKLFMDRLWHTLTGTFAFDVRPMPLRPIMDIYANKNPFTGRDIESMKMEQMSKEKRKNAYTSETATLVSESLHSVIPWDKVTLSPVELEYLVNGYGAWVGATVLNAVDSMVRMGEGNEAPDRGIYSLPVAGRFVERYFPDMENRRNTKYTTRFYDQVREMNNVYNDIREMRILSDIAGARDKADKNRMVLRYRTSYNKLRRRLSKINTMVQRITKDPNMDGDLKTVRINRLNAIKDQLTASLVGSASSRMNQ